MRRVNGRKMQPKPQGMRSHLVWLPITLLNDDCITFLLYFSSFFFNLLGWFIQVRSFSCCDVAFNQAKIVSTWWLAIFAWQTRAVTSFLQLTARYFLHFWTLDLIRLYFFLQSLIDFLIRRWPSVPISFEFLVFIFQRDLKETSRDNIDIGFSFTH